MDTLSYKTISANKATVTKEWVIVDATDQVLGRLGAKVAKLLRGKYKPNFTPHVDCGDNVIIINADKVKMTGNKWTDKVYLSYTGYPGGQREMTPARLQAKPNGDDRLKMIAGGKVSTNDIAGPVRIVTIIDQTVEENTQYGFVTVVMNLLNLMVMFSANLGVMNLLPFPALDGGRLVFLLWELVTRQPVSQRVESAVNMAGMALLMTFMVFVVFNDLRMIF